MVLGLGLPWLNPLTYGPTQPVLQFLAVWMGAALCLLAGTRPAYGPRGAVIAGAWLCAACASACIALLQYLGFAGTLSPWVNYVDAGQAYANLRQRNQLATLLAIGWCALLWWQSRPVASALPQAWRRLPQGVLVLATAVLAAADAASGSRTGLLQLLLLLALALVWKRGRGALVWACVAYALAAWLLPQLAGLDPLQTGILGRLGEPASACASRLTLWSNVLHLIAQKPWTGWGWGELEYAHFMALYAGPRFCEILGNAHNLPLHMAVEWGVPAAVLVCATLGGLVLRAQPWRERDATRQMAWSVLAVIGLHSLLEYPLWYAPFQLAALLALWLLWSTPQAVGSTAATPKGAAARPGSTALACAVLLACSYAGWDYWRISQIYLPPAQRDPAYRDHTLEKISSSWLFADPVVFAELGTTALTRDNAQHVHALALRMLHFSPEPSVVAKLIDSAQLLGLSEEVQAYRTRFAAAYPQEYIAWLAGPTPAVPGN